jgi:hypothetical protein
VSSPNKTNRQDIIEILLNLIVENYFVVVGILALNRKNRNTIFVRLFKASTALLPTQCRRVV